MAKKEWIASLYQPDIHEFNNWMLGNSILMEIRLKETVDDSSLLKAAQQMQECYAALQTRPMLYHGNLIYVENKRSIKILSYQHNQEMSFGGESTHFYPWFVGKNGNTIAFLIDHGLTDGLGMECMAKTLLYYYFTARGVTCSSDGIYTRENRMKNQEIQPVLHFSSITPESKPSHRQKHSRASFFEERYKDPASKEKRIVRLTFDTASFMRKVHTLKTTPFALEALVCFKALRTMMKDVDPIMSLCVEASLRQVFDFDTTHKFLTSQSIQCTPSLLDKLTDEELCHQFRTVMNQTLDKSNVLSALKQRAKSLKKLNSIKPFSFRKALYSRIVKGAATKILGDECMLSYWGKLELQPSIAEKVEDVNVILQYKESPLPLIIESYSINDRFVISALTYLKDNTLFDNIVNTLQSYDVAAQIEDAYMIHDITYDCSAIKPQKAETQKTV